MDDSGRRRVVVLGYVVGFPLGGMTWHSVQYAMGLARMGHDVWVLEDSDDYETCYDPTTYEVGTDPTYGLAYAARVFERIGLGDRWTYHHAHTRSWHGPAADKITDVCATADVVLNLAGIHPLRPWLEGIPARVFVDADPAFTQIRHLTDPAAKQAASRHTHFFSFGEAIPGGGSSVPDDGFPWKATRQPVVLDAWPVTPAPPDAPFTTVMQWDSYAVREHEGVRYGMKSASFDEILSLPSHGEGVFELAVGSVGTEDRARLERAGWRIADAQEVTTDPWTYQRYIAASGAELSVAKHGYVVSRSGWFSERSACYLASGRPVVLQDTGFSSILPTGEGLLAYTDLEGAAAAVSDLRSRYEHHVRRARELADEHFAAERVLGALLSELD